MEPDSEDRKTTSVAGALLASLAACALLGGFIYWRITSAMQLSLADQSLAADRTRDEAVSGPALREEDALTSILTRFVQAVSANEVDRMLALATRPYRESMDPKKFARALGANPYLRAGGTFAVRRTTLRGGTARWEGTFQSSMGAVTLVADFGGEEAGWRLSGLAVGGVQAFPPF